MKASIIVSFAGNDARLQRCFEAIRAQDFHDFELLLIDGRITGLSESEGQIEGVRRAVGEYVAFTNSDCLVPEDWLSRLLGLAEKGYDVVGGQTIRGGDIYSYAWNVPYYVHADQTSGLGFGFSNCLIRKSALSRVPIRPLPAHQDADFLIRARRDGLRIVRDGSIVVYHDHPLGSLFKAMRRQMLSSANYTYLLRLHYGTVAKTGLGLHTAFFRYMRGFVGGGRGLTPKYGNRVRYSWVRFWIKIAQLCGFAVGTLQDGLRDARG